MTADRGHSAETAYPLRDLARMIAGWIDRLGVVWVSGQLTEVKLVGQRCYMTLSDSSDEVSASLQCTANVYRAAGEPGPGTAIAAEIKVNYFQRTGKLSLQARHLEIQGAGRLLAQLDARRRMLQAEGLFDASLKKRLPLLPRGIGLITAADSAAEQDVLVNIMARWPQARVVVRHARMQGERCVAQVMERLRELDADESVDVIIIARGGGSLDDLLPFSDEGLVRAVAAARTPLVTAIGHEVDVPLIDYAADVRASTPTAAAKLVVPDVREELAELASCRQRLEHSVRRLLEIETQWLARERQAPVLRNPSATIDVHATQVAELQRRGLQAMQTRLRLEQAGLEGVRTRIETMSPKATLQRGYAILSSGGTTVSSVGDVAPDETVLAYLADGTLELTVNDIALEDE